MLTIPHESHESSRIESAGDQTRVESSRRVDPRISKNMNNIIRYIFRVLKKILSKKQKSRVGKNWPGLDSESSRLLTRKHHYRQVPFSNFHFPSFLSFEESVLRVCAPAVGESLHSAILFPGSPKSHRPPGPTSPQPSAVRRSSRDFCFSNRAGSTSPQPPVTGHSSRDFLAAAMDERPVRLSPHHFPDKAHVFIQGEPFHGSKLDVVEFLFDRCRVVCAESAVHFLSREGGGGRSGYIIIAFFLRDDAITVR